MLTEDTEHKTRMTHYILEEIIHFYPDEHTLYNVINGDAVLLLSTASECFQILIEEQGKIISRTEMKEHVWGKRGVVVSSNTFYQTILNLRRGLEKAGAGSHIISTHYGKGVAVSNDVNITLAIQPDDRNFPSRSEISKLTISSPVKKITSDVKVGSYFHISDSWKVFYGFICKPLSVFVGNLILALICLIMLYGGHSLKRSNYFSHYTKSGLRIKGCDVFTDQEQLDKNMLNQFLAMNAANCEENETLYLSSIYPIQRVSVIRCKGNFLPGEKCKSDYYL